MEERHHQDQQGYLNTSKQERINPLEIMTVPCNCNVTLMLDVNTNSSSNCGLMEKQIQCGCRV